jgi:type IV secretory pathway TrbF-like protein
VKKRTTRTAWWLSAVLAVALVVALAVGYRVWSAGAVSVSVFLLEPRDWGFSRAIGDTNDSTMRDIEVEAIKLGVIRAVRLTRERPALVRPSTSTPSSTAPP